jgi:hypothetical protein
MVNRSSSWIPGSHTFPIQQICVQSLVGGAAEESLLKLFLSQPQDTLTENINDINTRVKHAHKKASI